MTTNPTISVIIPTFRRKPDLLRLLKSIASSDYPKEKLEVIVVDNAGDLSKSDLKQALKQMKLKLAQPKENLFCNGGRLYGAGLASGQYFFFVDDDNILAPDCIKILVESFKKNSSLGMAAPLMLLFKDKGRIWCAGGKLNKWGMTIHLEYDKPLNQTNLPEIIPDIDYFPNAFVIKREVLEKVPFDITNFPHNWSEPDFGLRMKKAGYTAATLTKSQVWHDIDYMGHTTRINSRNVYDQAKSRLLFRKRFLNNLRDWLAFWCMIFPVSTLYYIKAIITSADEKKMLMLTRYFKGTFDGTATHITADIGESIPRT